MRSAAGKADRLRADHGLSARGAPLAHEKSAEENDVVVASIFVNPTQFGPHEDLDRYPRDAEGDATKCASAGVDVLFCRLPQRCIRRSRRSS